MSWSGGFKALHEKLIVTNDLKRLDSLRQKQIMRFADAPVNYGPGRNHYGRGDLQTTGYRKSYVAQFRDVGGRSLIENPWRPENWKEKVMCKFFLSCDWLVNLKKTISAFLKAKRKQIARAFRTMPEVNIGETWTDTKFRRNEGGDIGLLSADFGPHLADCAEGRDTSPVLIDGFIRFSFIQCPLRSVSPPRWRRQPFEVEKLKAVFEAGWADQSGIDWDGEETDQKTSAWAVLDKYFTDNGIAHFLPNAKLEEVTGPGSLSPAAA
jgi:hypothetical protein